MKHFWWFSNFLKVKNIFQPDDVLYPTAISTTAGGSLFDPISDVLYPTAISTTARGSPSDHISAISVFLSCFH